MRRWRFRPRIRAVKAELPFRNSPKKSLKIRLLKGLAAGAKVPDWQP
jgi:hypothetical protein